MVRKSITIFNRANDSPFYEMERVEVARRERAKGPRNGRYKSRVFQFKAR